MNSVIVSLWVIAIALCIVSIFSAVVEIIRDLLDWTR